MAGVVRTSEQTGWCYYDWANSVYPTSVTTVFLALYLTDVAENAAEKEVTHNGLAACADDDALRDCEVNVLGTWIPAGSLWGYLLALTTVVQVLVLPIAGAVIDRSASKRRVLGGAAFSGAFVTTLLAFVGGSNWALAVPLFLVATTCFGVSVVAYYAFLPEIAGPDERDAVSSRGWALGFLGGGLALVLQLGIFAGHDLLGLTESGAVRVCFVLSGMWWAGFTLIPLSLLRDRPPDPSTDPPLRGPDAIWLGLRQIRDLRSEIRLYPITFAFLGAYLIFTDGIQTVTKVAAQYGDKELDLSRSTLIATVLIVQFVAFVGGVLHGRAAGRYGARRTILWSLGGWTVVVASAFVIQAGQPVQFCLLAVGIGLVLGGTNALSRSLFSQLVPSGKEARYFSFYEVGERATSWMGPLVFAGVAEVTGSYRPAILALVPFFVVGIVLTRLVPLRRGISTAGNVQPAVL